MSKLHIYMIWFISISFPVSAQEFQGGTESPFSLGTGGRELAMGAADIAGSSPVSSPYWNPSRLAGAETYALGGFHIRLFDSDAVYQYLGLVAPTLDFGTFGFGVFRLGVDNIEKRDANNLLLGSFDDNLLNFHFAYARTISGYDFGVAVTIEHQSLDNYSATSSPGLNLSATRRFSPVSTVISNIAVAVHARNIITPGIKLADQNVDYPREADLAVSVGISPSSMENHTLNISTALFKVDNVDTKIALGAEYGWNKIIFVRGGLRDGNPSAGIGLGLAGMSFDYAVVGRDLGTLHMFTLTSRFGKPLSERKRQKIERREAEFNRLMTKCMKEDNLIMILRMVQQGQEQLDANELTKAAGNFGRALFLARSLNIDTLKIYGLSLETQNRIDELRRKERFKQNLESSSARLAQDEYLAAKYFAELALDDIPESPQALEVLRKATKAIESIASNDEVVQNRLWQSDSLLALGQYEEALVALRALADFAPQNDVVRMTLRRAEFERWRESAEIAYSERDFESARVAVDSALARVPEHQRCLALRRQINVAEGRKQQQISAPITQNLVSLSKKLGKEVESAYQSARLSFERGDLQAAVGEWEWLEQLAPNYKSVRDYLVKAYKFVGVELYGQDKLQEAVDVWRKAWSLQPLNVEIQTYIERTETEIEKLRILSYDIE